MIKDIDGLLEKITEELKAFTARAVIGLSGGADSTLVACLCVKALGPDKVHGLHMPYNQFDKDTFNTLSRALSYYLKINSDIVEIGDSVDSLLYQFGGLYNISKINQGNMRSRIRMAALYTACKGIEEDTKERTRVIGTGNLSEDFIGYDAKGGDALCDFFPIGSLLKSEVYQLLEYFRDQGYILEEHINRVPSAGLWNGQTDEDELGYTYEEMESYVIHGLINGAHTLYTVYPKDEVAKFVADRHLANKHKHQGPPVIDLRRFCE